MNKPNALLAKLVAIVFAIPLFIGALGPFPADSSGFQYQGGSGENGLSPATTGFRFMDQPSGSPYAYLYPNGYGSYNNSSIPPQTVNPLTGRTIPPSDPSWHIPSKHPAL